MSLAVIWHYWIGLAFFLLSILVVVGTIVGYLVKVESLKFPKTVAGSLVRWLIPSTGRWLSALPYG